MGFCRQSRLAPSESHDDYFCGNLKSHDALQGRPAGGDGDGDGDG
jgi:hypothetical protein